MDADFDRGRPIYRQIIEEIQRQIARGELSPGQQVPSQRELALKMRVNPNTIQRVYREMENMGIIETRRGQGTFIVEKSDLVEITRKKLAQKYYHQFVRNMSDLGLTKKDIENLLKTFSQEGKNQELEGVEDD